MIGVILVQSLILVIVVIQPVFWDDSWEFKLGWMGTRAYTCKSEYLFSFYPSNSFSLFIHAGTWLLEVRILYGSMYMKYGLLRVL